MGKSLKNSQRTIAAVSIASLALLNVGIMAPANAAVDANGLEVANQDPTKIPATADLTVTKRTPNNNEFKNNGLKIEGDTLPGDAPIENVKFSLFKISGEGLDITTNAGWRKANEIAQKWKEETTDKEADSITVGGKSYSITPVSGDNASQVTGTNGVAKFTGVPRGFYVVRESLLPESENMPPKVNRESYKASDITLGAPFVVALPMTHATDLDKWNRDVHVYPKNSVVAVKKEVDDITSPGTGNKADAAADDANTTVDSKIVYTITTDVPQGVETIKSYRITDALDERLTWVEGTENVLTMLTKVDGQEELQEVPLEEGENKDYTIEGVDVDQANPADSNDKVKKQVTVTFTETGRAKLVSQKARKVQWKLPALLNKDLTVGDSAATIDNQAFLLPDNEASEDWTPGTPPPGTPSNKVVSKYGKVTLHKVDENDGEKNLEGAEFALYTCTEQGLIMKDNEIDEKHRVFVNNKNTFTTDGEGRVDIQGLQLNDFANGSSGETLEAARTKAREDAKNFTNTHYCLVETKAPAGYELLTNPIKFQLLENGNKTVKELTIKNVPSNGGFDLPLTGGKGIFGLIALGALLVLGSIGYIFFASRRQES